MPNKPDGRVGEGMRYDVEHALVLYAEDYVIIPAKAIYDDDVISSVKDVISGCHIYAIGLLPIVDFVGASQNDRTLVCHLKVLNETKDVKFSLPDGINLGAEEDIWYLSDAEGVRYWPSEPDMQRQLQAQTGCFNFNVLYVGQAYGKEGERNALDRLRKHETLQRIAVEGIPEGYALYVLMLSIQTGNRTMTVFNPFAEDKSQGEDRIRMGLNKLFDTDEGERVTLYEASLIRHFEPKFNKAFKESFPSTNLKVLADCYEKDFSAIVAEISIDELPFSFLSEKVPATDTVLAAFHLHSAADRKAFFFGQ